ncbi:MAG: 4-hydroxy-tetrahydrodipicolinate synthase [Thermoleophilaceae bacterium]|nr:4-hydroxy-tetrahydrodipicolinate synthase [Thermoleophilaceae bacterium]
MDLGAILTAMVTPFDADLRVDHNSTAKLLDHLLANGSDGVVVAGTTGEAPTLSDEEHLELIGFVTRHCAGRASVIAGTGSNDTRHACHLTEKATQHGVDAVLVVTPYYNRPNRRGIVRHFEEVARATDKPVILYNIPARTGTDMPNDLLAELAQIDGVEGVKQANGDSVAMIDGLQLYAGDDDMLAKVLDLGGTGGITVASHIVGPQMRRMVDEPSERAAINEQLQDIFAALGVTTNPIPVKGWKASSRPMATASQ